MTALMTRSVVLFLCWEIVAQCSAKELSISFDDLSAILNGRFNNFNKQENGQDMLELYFKPALAPALQNGPVLYFEEILNGHVYRMWVVTRNESSTDRLLYLDLFNFTDPSQHEPRTFNTDDLANYKREDFQKREDSQAIYEKTDARTLVATTNDPRHTVNGRHPLYAVAVTCDDFRLIVPISSDETTTQVPYDLEHVGPRYPLIDAQEGFVDPCQDGQ